MPFRRDLDLSDFIEDYQPWLEGREVVQRVPQGYNDPLQVALTPTLTKAGHGPLLASSCTDLMLHPVVIWDVNGYYRALGVDPRADRKTLRRAYIEAGGVDDDYLTYVLQQLLDPETRRDYDATPLGQPYLDRYVELAIKRSAMAEASRRAGRHATEEEVVEVMREQGFDLAPADAVGGGSYSPDDDEWRWSYYLDEVVCHDTDRLSLWQQMLVSALSETGHVIRFAVGFTQQGDTHQRSFTRTESGGYVVAYLGATTQPTVDMARFLASHLVHAATPPATPHR
jgi:hypothetical protein